ncbi:hypothetical protein PQX77_001201 [Marasmius sp. AFHP31]|nr:hypothetical protein PQX77_001201 [Marasmius sp. AFHP31]
MSGNPFRFLTLFIRIKALRGASPSFGVTTSIEVETFLVPTYSTTPSPSRRRTQIRLSGLSIPAFHALALIMQFISVSSAAASSPNRLDPRSTRNADPRKHAGDPLDVESDDALIPEGVQLRTICGGTDFGQINLRPGGGGEWQYMEFNEPRVDSRPRHPNLPEDVAQKFTSTTQQATEVDSWVKGDKTTPLIDEKTTSKGTLQTTFGNDTSSNRRYEIIESNAFLLSLSTPNHRPLRLGIGYLERYNPVYFSSMLGEAQRVNKASGGGAEGEVEEHIRKMEAMFFKCSTGFNNDQDIMSHLPHLIPITSSSPAQSALSHQTIYILPQSPRPPPHAQNTTKNPQPKPRRPPHSQLPPNRLFHPRSMKGGGVVIRCRAHATTGRRTTKSQTTTRARCRARGSQFKSKSPLPVATVTHSASTFYIIDIPNDNDTPDDTEDTANIDLVSPFPRSSHEDLETADLPLLAGSSALLSLPLKLPPSLTDETIFSSPMRAKTSMFSREVTLGIAIARVVLTHSRLELISSENEHKNSNTTYPLAITEIWAPSLPVS